MTKLTEGGLSARLLRPGEEKELLELLQEAFSHWPSVETDATPLEHLRWKLGSGDCARHIVLEEEGRLVAAMVCLCLPLKLGGPPVDIVDVSRFDSAVDGLWREASSQFDFAVVRDERYLNWRYADPRAGRFRTRAALADGEMLGYAVSRVTRGRGYVCDLLALPGRLDVAAALLEDAVAGLRTRRVAQAELWLARRHPYYALARRQGFVGVRRLPNFGFEALRLPAERVAFLDDSRARVHLTIGDTDLV